MRSRPSLLRPLLSSVALALLAVGLVVLLLLT